jgi:hypothetical protein
MHLMINGLEKIDFGVLRSVYVKDLFEIKQGIPMSLKRDKNAVGGERYAIVQPSDLNNGLKEDEAMELQEIRMNKSISDEKLLQEFDYLVTCKGYVIKGFGLKATHLVKYPRILANSHFIVLRPLKTNFLSIHDAYVPFVHFLMDRLVETLNELETTKSYITIKELGNLLLLDEVSFQQLEAFGRLYATHTKIEDKFKESNKSMNQFYQELKKYNEIL